MVKLLLNRGQNERVRRNAANALGDVGRGETDGIAALISALDDANQEVRLSAVMALRDMGAEAQVAIPALIEALYDGDQSSDVSLMASNALVQWGKHSEESVLALINALHRHRDEHIRDAAASALGLIGTAAKRAVPSLIVAFHDKSPMVRRSAGEVLATMAKESKSARVALPGLIDALQDADPAIRRTAAYVLQDIGTEARNAIPALITALQKDSTAVVRSRAANALGHVGKEAVSAISSLTAALDDREAQEPEAEVRYAAAQALGNIASQLEGLDIPQLLTIHRALAGLSALQGVDEAQETAILDATEQVRAARRQIFITLCLVLLAGALLVVATASLSPKVRRRLLLLIGRRWALVTGRCDAVIEVYDQAIIVRLMNDDRPDPPGALSPKWPPSDSLIHEVRKHLVESKTVRLLTFSEAQFCKPWAHVIGPSRSDRNGTSMVGQLCIGKGARLPEQPSAKHVAFIALGCARPSDSTLGTLNEVDVEIEAVQACFRRWGADPSELKLNATRGDVLRAFASADVVHIAAHADPDAIHLADGKLTAEDLQPLLVAGQRCRLLAGC
jgi:HEAT repeat protein